MHSEKIHANWKSGTQRKTPNTTPEIKQRIQQGLIHCCPQTQPTRLQSNKNALTNIQCAIDSPGLEILGGRAIRFPFSILWAFYTALEIVGGGKGETRPPAHPPPPTTSASPDIRDSRGVVGWGGGHSLFAYYDRMR